VLGWTKTSRFLPRASPGASSASFGDINALQTLDKAFEEGDLTYPFYEKRRESNDNFL